MEWGISQELLGPQKWFTYQNLWNFVRKFMEVLSMLLLFEEKTKNVNKYSILSVKKLNFLRQIGPGFQKANFYCGQIKLIYST